MCVSCGGSSVPLPAQHSLTSALPLPREERACTQGMCWDGPAEGQCCGLRDVGKDAAPAWLETCDPEPVLCWAPALWGTPQIALSQGHCTTLHPFTRLSQSQAAFFLSLLLFLLLKGHCGKQRGPKKSGSLLPGNQV